MHGQPLQVSELNYFRRYSKLKQCDDNEDVSCGEEKPIFVPFSVEVGINRILCTFMLILLACSIIIVKSIDKKIKNVDNQMITSWKNLKLYDIKNWCLNEEKESCICANPFMPKHRREFNDKWYSAHLNNIEQAKKAIYSSKKALDVVFLGDSITEGWNGSSYGEPVERKKDIHEIFESLFQEQNAEFSGLAMGISGDKSRNLLWRIQNGEIPSNLHPRVWWILIGTNDFIGYGEEYCGTEVVFWGIIRVIDELRAKRPNAIIVVNALLPRADQNQNGILFSTEESNQLWLAIESVNDRLKEYCDQEGGPSLHYLNYNKIFIAKNSSKDNEPNYDTYYIDQELMADYLHPTAAGYQRWGNKIIKDLRDLFHIENQ